MRIYWLWGNGLCCAYGEVMLVEISLFVIYGG